MSRASARDTTDVCLVSMPYARLSSPSLALGLLKAILAESGITATVVQANLAFAEVVGVPRYELCSSSVPTVYLMGEWTFAAAAFGDDPRRDAKDAEYLRQVAAAAERRALFGLSAGDRGIADDLRSLRAAATAFVDETAQRILATGARVVGCTSTFEQHVASLALLRRIRELDPDVVTMIGGANCETVMGEATHRCFPWVDYVASGEADGIIARLCRLALDKGRDVSPADVPAGVLGPCHRSATGARSPAGSAPRLPRALFSDFDSLPTPDYSDYFATLAGSPLREVVRPGIPLESSRGCWWGAAHQCTFCGLNGTGMGFRAKSAERVLAEMRELEDRHGISDFEMVDNILDMEFFKSLLPRLAEDRPRRIFYEIKANLTRAHVETLVRSGVTWAQPGIESLHSDVLKLVSKGVKGWQNVQLLKWSRELGLRLSWLVLWGFPGEQDEWYEEMAGWLPALEHLQPPAGTTRLRYDRYSVYHEQASRTGLVLFPIGAMSMIYPVWPADLDRLAYFFSTEPAAGPVRLMESTAAELQKRPSINELFKGVVAWKDAYRQGRSPSLWMADGDGTLVITDTRTCAARERHVLTGLDRAVCLACENAPRPAKLAQLVRDRFGLTAAGAEIEAAVGRLTAARLVLAMDDRLVGLALSGQPSPVLESSQFPGGYVSNAKATAGSR